MVNYIYFFVVNHQLVICALENKAVWCSSGTLSNKVLYLSYHNLDTQSHII